jgi:N-acyl-D-amino-acid deacylase
MTKWVFYSIVFSLCLLLGLLLLLWWKHLPPSQVFDLLIINGKVVDGTGKPAFEANIGIKGDKIAAVGHLRRAYAPVVIDAQGCVVAPGFIDVHTHVEANLPRHGPFCAPNFIRQGVTTIITGNCGRSVEDVGLMFQKLEQYGSQVNVATLIGHNTVRQKVMRNATRPPTPVELRKMEDLVRKAMEDGALGLSTGLEYLPGMFAPQWEIVALAKVAGQYGGLYVTHLRDEGLKVFDAVKEALEIGHKAKVNVHLSHLKIAAPKLWKTATQLLDLIDSQKQSIQVTMDCYPYTSSSTGLIVLLPKWSLKGGERRLRLRLHNELLRQRIRQDMISEAIEKGWKDFSFARIASCWFDPSLNGYYIHELAQFNHKWQQQLPSGLTEIEQEAEVILELLKRGGAQMIYECMSEDDLEEIMRHKNTMFGSDSSVRYNDMKSKPHPRGYGTFPRVLARYVREKGVLSLEEAIRKMTSLPAKVFKLGQRGEIKEGYFADLVIFDEHEILDTSTYDEPFNPPKGIYFVLVNGQIVFENGNERAIYPGRPIRRAIR